MRHILTATFLLCIVMGHAQQHVFFQGAEWSKDNRLLVSVIRMQDKQFSFQTYLYDASTQSFNLLKDSSSGASWVPGDKQIAYANVNRATRKADIFVYDLESKTTRQLTHGGYNSSPYFSPDGKQLCFTSTRDGSYQVYVMDADGNNVRRITSDTIRNYNPVWSPAGDKIVY
jgi:Tol biopolymer transport system component